MLLRQAQIFFGKYRRISQRILWRNFRTFPEYKDQLQRFHESYPHIKKYLLSKVKHEHSMEEFGKMMDYQLKSGRQTRIAITLKAYEALTSGADLPPDEKVEGIHRIHVVAWINEVLQAMQIVIDDLVDKATLRRGEAPWHVGHEDDAIYYLLMLSAAPSFLLNGWFGKDKFFLSASNLLLEHSFDAPVNQLCDMNISRYYIENKNLSWERFYHYICLKSAYSTHLPFKLAAYVATNKDIEFTPEVDKILDDIAGLLQLYNDSLTLSPEYIKILGKDDDEDLRVKKVNFALIHMLQNSTNEDRDLIVSLFGKDDQKSIEKVKEMYQKYDVVNASENFLENWKKSLRKRINAVSNEFKFRDALHVVQDTVEKYPLSDPRVQTTWSN